MVSNDENSVRKPLAYNKEHVTPCIRDFGVTPGYLPPGSMNAITDVKGVCEGHRAVAEKLTLVLLSTNLNDMSLDSLYLHGLY